MTDDVTHKRGRWAGSVAICGQRGPTEYRWQFVTCPQCLQWRKPRAPRRRASAP